MRELVITSRDCGQRLDKYLAKYLSRAPKGFLYKMMRKKNITLNQAKCDGSERLEAGDCIRMFFAEETFAAFCEEEKPEKELLPIVKDRIQVIYEDQHILFLNKRAGELSQKAKETDVSLVEQILVHAVSRGLVTQESLKTCRPSVCNRLDRNTSGLVAAGLSLPGLAFLSEQLKTRAVRKYYLCLAFGAVAKPFLLKGYLAKDEASNRVQVAENLGDLPLPMQKDARWIETEFIPLAFSRDASLLRVHLITGRSHQIRAHLASIGHPIIGDPKYGDPAVNRRYRQSCGVSRQLLHAFCMEFGPVEGSFSYLSYKSFTAPLPADFKKAMKQAGIHTDEEAALCRHGIQED